MKENGKVRDILLGMQETLRGRIAAVSRDLESGRSADSEERVTESENDSTLEEIGQQSQSELFNVEKALHKLDQGTYGSCEACGKQVPAARLAAIPHAIKCIDCAE